jgi:hypothetical protein
MAIIIKLLRGHAVLVLCLGLVAGMLNAGEDPPPLSQIEEFYSDYNFISSLTSIGERTSLAAGLKTYTLPKDMDSRRFREVFERMIRVSQRVHVVDPEMLAPQDRSWDPMKQLFRSEFFDVMSMRTTKDGVAVTIATHAVEPQEVLRFIQDYEDPPEGWRYPSQDELLNRLARVNIRTREIHLWQVKGGRWMKLDSHFTYLDLKKR